MGDRDVWGIVILIGILSLRVMVETYEYYQIKSTLLAEEIPRFSYRFKNMRDAWLVWLSVMSFISFKLLDFSNSNSLIITLINAVMIILVPPIFYKIFNKKPG